MMYPNAPNQPGGGGPGDDLKGGFAATAAAMVSLILSPPINEFTQPYVIYWAIRSYPSELVELISIAWMILIWPLVFFAARAGIVYALTAAGIYLAYRFF